MEIKPKTYNLMRDIGKVRYAVTFYTGEDFDADGSILGRLALYNDKRVANQFVSNLIRQGYTGNGTF